MPVQVRAKEQQQKLVKKAAAIARDVVKFWSKARSVHNFSVQEKVEAIKRRKLDKELEDFVTQSEKYGFTPSTNTLLCMRIVCTQNGAQSIAASMPWAG